MRNAELHSSCRTPSCRPWGTLSCTNHDEEHRAAQTIGHTELHRPWGTQLYRPWGMPSFTVDGVHLAAQTMGTSSCSSVCPMVCASLCAPWFVQVCVPHELCNSVCTMVCATQCALWSVVYAAQSAPRTVQLRVHRLAQTMGHTDLHKPWDTLSCIDHRAL